MPYALTWMPDTLLSAGLKVARVPGWKVRGHGDVGETLGVMCHHTANGRPGNLPSLQTLIRGRKNLSGPLCQLALGRDGTYYVVAAGRAYHAGKGMWNGITEGNHHFIGIEAEHSGKASDPWPSVQMDAFRRGVAALLAHAGLPASACAGHKEYALPRGRKIDPTFDMQTFRGAVAALLAEPSPPTLIPPVEPEPPSGPGTGRATLRRGAHGPLVREAQRRLGLADTGYFDAVTEAAVRAFQRQRGLVPDGIVGPKTWQALDDVAMRVVARRSLPVNELG